MKKKDNLDITNTYKTMEEKLEKIKFIMDNAKEKDIDTFIKKITKSKKEISKAAFHSNHPKSLDSNITTKQEEIKSNIDSEVDFVEATTNIPIENKNKILLLMNDTLLALGKPTINNILDFNNVKRSELIKLDQKIIIEKLKDILFPTYQDKRKYSYYNSKNGNRYIINILRNMCQEVNIGIYYKRQKKTKQEVRSMDIHDSEHETIYMTKYGVQGPKYLK